jgi:integrase
MANKRGQGEGTYLQRPSGRWQAQTSLDGRRLSKTFDTAKECREWLREIDELKTNGLSIRGAKITVGAYLEIWLENIQSTLRPRTWEQYASNVNNYLKPSLGDIRLGELQPLQIQSFYTLLRRNGLGDRTIQLVHSVLHRALVIAHRQGLIGRNPAAAVERPKVSYKEMRLLDGNQARSFLIAVMGTRDEALYHIALKTGMRQGEILGLRWSDLDWSSGELHVKRKLQRVTGQGLVFSEPKTRAGSRMILLGSSLLDILTQHYKRQDIERQRPNWQENNLIFPSTTGTPYDQRNLLREFKKSLKEAGLPDIRFHDLRHTAATIMLLENTPLLTVARRLGHSKPSVTLDVYGHYLPGMQEQVATTMDEVLTPVAAELQRKVVVGDEID